MTTKTTEGRNHTEPISGLDPTRERLVDATNREFGSVSFRGSVDRPTYRLELRPERGDTVDPVLRLRAALKTLLRAFRLRCVSVVEVKPTPDLDSDEPPKVSEK